MATETPTATTSYRTTYLNRDNRRSPKSEIYCIVCYKSIKPNSEKLEVHLVDGGPFALRTEDEGIYFALSDSEKRGDMGFWRIGPDCAKKLGREYIWSINQ